MQASDVTETLDLARAQAGDEQANGLYVLVKLYYLISTTCIPCLFRR